MKPDKYFRLRKTAYVSAAAFALVLFCNIQGMGFQSSSGSQQIPLVRKRAELTERQTAAASGRLIVQLNGMQAQDVINLRPGSGAGAEVAAGTARMMQRGNVTSAANAMSPGQPLPNTALEVATDNVSFVRPEGLEDAVFLDIQIPAHRRVKVIIDRQVILSGTLSQPLIYHNQQWEQGAKGVAGVYVRATGVTEAAIYGEQVQYDSNAGSYYVPFSKLQVLQSQRVALANPAPVAAMLQVNESGQVDNVIFLTNTPPSGAEQSVQKWRFAPYLVEGRPVSFMTIVWLKK